ncbi:glycosyltransferase [Chitinispirillales bacterium ANBcel5]|uniref:glycosyltransferase family 2 protein n=1 Tax=Cellulosispirillum alkaliphilum TaxID=3039283 RepID=UPI002A53DDDE|nr:glycosyltransferase [Chitinispirillales bacterium ANBcel5]
MSNNEKTTSLSIIIPTLNRPQDLKRALKSLGNFWVDGYEVIVVDQSDTYNHTTAQKNHPQVKFIRQKRKNLPLARNNGIKQSGGEIILFIDDDCEIKGNCIKQHLQAHRDLSCGVVAGRVRQKGTASWAATDVVSTIDPLTGETTGNFDLDYHGEVEYATGANFSVKRGVLYRSGLFNERFTGNALFEDVDFSLRVRKAGFKIIYDPKALVHHHGRSYGGCHESREYRYYLSRLHNHLLFYLLHFGKIPQKVFIIYLKNLIEYLSRKANSKHSFKLLALSGMQILKAYIDFLASCMKMPLYLKKQV